MSERKRTILSANSERALPDRRVRGSHARALLRRILRPVPRNPAASVAGPCAERISSDAASMPARYAWAPPFPGPKRFLLFFTERICPAINRRLAAYCAKVTALLADTPCAASIHSPIVRDFGKNLPRALSPVPGKGRLDAKSEKVGINSSRPSCPSLLVPSAKSESHAPSTELHLHRVVRRRFAAIVDRTEDPRSPVTAIVFARRRPKLVCHLLATFSVQPCWLMCRYLPGAAWLFILI